MKISRRRLADHVKKLHQKVCRTCGTITFPHSTNQIIDLRSHFLNSLPLQKRSRPLLSFQITLSLTNLISVSLRLQTFTLHFFIFCIFLFIRKLFTYDLRHSSRLALLFISESCGSFLLLCRVNLRRNMQMSSAHNDDILPLFLRKSPFLE